MIRPPSNQKTYDEFWSGDPAFVQPPAEPAEDADDATIKKYREAVDDHVRKLKHARATGDWSALLAGADQPTRFVMRPLPGHLFRMITDLVTSERIGPAETNGLILRAALVGVVNLGDVEVDHKTDSTYPKLGKIATVDVPNLLDRIDIGIVAELATSIRERAMSPSPN